ncbi:aminotransferase class I/II-fold pyridoxal phosphate-dependent enzyme [Clostridium sp. SHJSY1]|uniref:aminotransferase class I/II-fold pyridoxal phosphate-dependent enzyme n=1 Tax=Clostridium sp. SHJSY1 TaxID=2942483 RepID=UPI00287BB44F|nr:aminotransferase class I/II-fold pyridoxal phosphate-dependent enzyme [Clostridium sp. SHJSY1]
MDFSTQVLSSGTNFVLCKPPEKVNADFIVKKLYEYKIYIRYFNSPMLDDKLRITVGKVNEIDRLIKALKEILD